MTKKRVHSVLPLSFLDYPDELSCVIFFSGCNFRCKYCHNARVVVDPPTTSLDDVLRFLRKQKSFLTAVVLSGGEPTLQPLSVLRELCRSLKSLGYLVKLDTNGTAPHALKALIDEKLVDYIAMDVKHLPDISFYRKVTPISKNLFAKVTQSIELLRSAGVRVEFRTTVAYPLHTRDDVDRLKHLFPGITIQDYSPQGEQLFRDIELRRLEENAD